MRAIILPLSKIIYNFEKHNGVAFGERMCKKYPAYDKFVNSKFGWWTFCIFFGIPIFIVTSAFYFLPLYFILFVRFGYGKAKIKMHARLDKLGMQFSFDSRRLLTRVRSTLEHYQLDKTAVFVYYTSEMIPGKKRKIKKFFEKLVSMRKEFNIAHVQMADTDEDIETMIWLFDIDRIELFLATMQIELSAPELVIPFKSKTARNKESGMIADKNEYQFSSVDSFFKDGKSPLAASGRGCIRMEPIHENMDDESEDDEPRFDFAFYMWLCKEGYIQDRDD